MPTPWWWFIIALLLSISTRQQLIVKGNAYRAVSKAQRRTGMQVNGQDREPALRIYHIVLSLSIALNRFQNSPLIQRIQHSGLSVIPSRYCWTDRRTDRHNASFALCLHTLKLFQLVCNGPTQEWNKLNGRHIPALQCVLWGRRLIPVNSECAV